MKKDNEEEIKINRLNDLRWNHFEYVATQTKINEFHAWSSWSNVILKGVWFVPRWLSKHWQAWILEHDNVGWRGSWSMARQSVFWYFEKWKRRGFYKFLWVSDWLKKKLSEIDEGIENFYRCEECTLGNWAKFESKSAHNISIAMSLEMGICSDDFSLDLWSRFKSCFFFAV